MTAAHGQVDTPDPATQPATGDGAPPGGGGRPGGLRIAMISYYLPTGSKIGVGYWVDQFARALAGRGHAVTIWSSCPPPPQAPYHVVQVPLTGSNRTFRFALHLRQVDFSDYDILHAHGDDYWLWRRRVPAHVRTMHGSCFSEALRIHGARERLRMAALGVGETLATFVADHTAVISPPTRRWMPWVTTVIPDGVDLARFTADDGVPRSEQPSILFVGTFEQRKRGRLLFEAFQQVVRPALPKAELWAVSEDFPPAPGVVRCGRLSDRDLTDLYHRAWVFCLPSSYEGLGIPYIEAMASGLPVVATANPGARFVTRDGLDGLLVDADALGPGLLRLLRDGGTRRALADAGRHRAELLSLTRTVEQYERIYQDLLRPPRPTRSRSPA